MRSIQTPRGATRGFLYQSGSGNSFIIAKTHNEYNKKLLDKLTENVYYGQVRVDEGDMSINRTIYLGA